MTQSMLPLRWGRRTLKFLGIDPAVGFVLFGYVWIGAFGIGQMALLIRYLSGAEQGVHFNLIAFYSFYILFDFGFGIAIQQLASHQKAFLHETPGGVLAGPSSHHARLAAILRLTMKWYAGVFLLWTAVMLPMGWIFFQRGVSGLEGVDWQVAWILTVVGTGGFLVTAGFAKFLSGCGDITPVARVTT